LPDSEPLLSVENLAVEFPGAPAVQAVRGISFVVKPGEIVSLVGESGSGKSVTALALMGLHGELGARITAGVIEFQQRDLARLSDKELRKIRGRDMGMVFQDPLSSLDPLFTVGWQIAEAIKLHFPHTRQATIRERVIELIAQVGIPNPAERFGQYPYELSGGMRQRVMIAMALANEPDLLIADEPTTALDVTIQAQILELLKQLQREMGMAMLLITHDLGIVRKMADRVYIMNAGEIVEEGVTEDIFTKPQHGYTKKLLAAEPKGTPPPANDAAPVVVETDDLKVWFPIKRGLLRRTVDHVKAVDGVTLKLRKGQTLGVVGESGSGKTTLGLALARMISSTGAIQFNGRDINQLSFNAMRPLRRELQIVFQDPFGSLSPRLSISEIIEEGLKIHEAKLSPDERDDKVVASLVLQGAPCVS